MRAIAVVFLTVPLLAQHGRYLSDSHHPSIGNPEAIAAGTKLFMGSCAGCHGPDGGGGARGPNLVRRSLWHPLSDEAIFQVIRKGVPGTDMPPTKLTDDQTWNLVAFIHALTGPASTNPVPGDAAAGKAVYWGAKAGCANCHAIRGQGGKTAPDLSNVGGSRPLAVIRESIVEPGKDLTYLGNEAAVVELKDGRTLRGVAKNRSNYSLQLVDGTGRLHLLRMSDVKELTLQETTAMPVDYGTRLSRTELRDLLAYLAAQDIRPAEGKGSK
ncbi:MAG: c-type cytochrome [Bryobacterales bacterium]|nr:c-type cytochrome [Bryobacterales bacterium]